MKWIFRKLLSRRGQRSSKPVGVLDGAAFERDAMVAASSPSGRLRLHWLLSDDGNSRCGAVLLNGERQLLFIDRLVRPEDARVADDGSVLVMDWGEGASLSGTVVAADCARGVTMRIPTRANLGSCGISLSGSFGAFHTFGANTPDGEQLFLLDLREKQILWKADVPEAWPDRYALDEDNEVLRVSVSSGRSFSYGFDGRVLDADAREAANIADDREDSHGYRLFDRASAKLATLGDREAKSEDIEAVRGLLIESLERSMSPNTRARAFRVLGELAERTEAWDQAHEWYSRALDENPRVGVKRRFDQITRMLEEGTG